MTKEQPKRHPLSIEKYGVWWRPVSGPNGTLIRMPDWQVEKTILEYPDDSPTLQKIPGYMGRAGHMMRFFLEVWGNKNGIFYFEDNPYTYEILEKYCEHKILSLAGHTAASKTTIMAVIAITEFLLSPFETKILVTSITKTSAQGKVWGGIEEAWQQAAAFFGGEKMLPGRLMGNSTIRYEYQGVESLSAGIELVPGEKSAAKESAAKIQGYHRQRLILMGDEWATLEKAIHETAMSNLRANPEAKLLAALNPDSHYDPGGKISEPLEGWSSVDINDHGWATKVGGWCIHFDGEKSPNVVAGKKIWRGIIDQTMINEIIGQDGKDTKKYFQMVRGWWSPTGAKECIYSEAEIINHGADCPVNTWVSTPVMIASLDPAFATGGDRAIATIAKVGIAKNINNGSEQKVCEVIKVTALLDDATNKKDSRSEQVVRDFRKLLLEYNVETRNVAVDATGGGDPFSALLARDIGTGFIMVQFKGTASDLPVSRNDKRKGCDRFVNKVSELWYVGKELVRTGQIKGLDPDTITELTSRTYKEIGGRVQVEPKDKMKQRTGGKSPDRADSVALVWEVARQRHGLSSTEKAAPKPMRKEDQRTIFDSVYNLALHTKRQVHAPPPLQEEQYYESIGGGWGMF